MQSDSDKNNKENSNTGAFKDSAIGSNKIKKPKISKLKLAIIIGSVLVFLVAAVIVVLYIASLQKSYEEDPNDKLPEGQKNGYAMKIITEEELEESLNNQGFAGLVTQVSSSKLVVKSIAGEVKEFDLDTETKVYKDFIAAKESSIDEIKVGNGVNLSYLEDTGKVTGIWVD